jgi:hypothetical protein
MVWGSSLSIGAKHALIVPMATLDWMMEFIGSRANKAKRIGGVNEL